MLNAGQVNQLGHMLPVRHIQDPNIISAMPINNLQAVMPAPGDKMIMTMENNL